jgi:hypothetical protein
MDGQLVGMGSIFRKTSAWLPVAMSVVALTMLLGSIAIYGGAREPDEGSVAHLWQILMAGQLPVIVFFAVKWLPIARREAMMVLAVQLVAALAAMAPVFILGL